MVLFICQDLQGQTALHHALSSQRTRAIPILLRAGADLTLLNTNFFHPLMDACGFGFLPYVTNINTVVYIPKHVLSYKTLTTSHFMEYFVL